MLFLGFVAFLGPSAVQGKVSRQELAVSIRTDQREIIHGEPLHVLLEISNRSSDRMFLPELSPPALNLRIRAQDSEGKELPKKRSGAYACLPAPPAYGEIPAASNGHLNIFVDRIFDLPETNRIRVSLEVQFEAQTIWTLDERDLEKQKTSGEGRLGPPYNKRIDIKVGGVFTSNSLEFELVSPKTDEERAVILERQRKGDEFLKAARIHWNAEKDDGMGSGTSVVEESTAQCIRNFVTAALRDDPGNPFLDDAWLEFAGSVSHHRGTKEAESLMRELIDRFPNSTGALQAQAYLSWPEGYLKRSHR